MEGHAPHTVVLPVVVASYVPAGQLWQTDAPATDEKVPAGQVVGAVEPNAGT